MTAAGRPDDRVATASAIVLRTRFDVAAERLGDTAVLSLQGELDLATAPRLRRMLGAVLDTRPSAVVLDLTELTFVDTSGVRVVRAACLRAAADGCSFALRAPIPSVRTTLRLTGVEGLVDVEDRPSVA